MSGTTFLVVVFVVWVATGLVTAYVMRRRGHALFEWGLLGAVFGPMVAVLAADAVHRERLARPRRVHPGERGAGPVDVVVGLDGSDESMAALRTVVDLLDGRLGRLCLVAVVDYDAAGSGAPAHLLDHATALLETVALAVAAHHPETVLLCGPPAEVLAAHAAAAGYHLLAVGSRGHGRSKAIMGSVATHLARGVGVPVLLAADRSTGRSAR